MADYTKARDFATLAIKFDQSKQIDQAIECYSTAALILDKCLSKATPEKKNELESKIQQYHERALSLTSQKETECQEEGERVVQQCYFLFQQALDADESGLKDVAIGLYTKAVEQGVSMTCSDPEVKSKIKNIAEKALDRAELLKGISKISSLSLTNQSLGISIAGAAAECRNDAVRPQLGRINSIQLKLATGKNTYTDEEKIVLMFTSKINDNQFVPFMDIDLSEKFQYAIPFEDKDGLLKLSTKQLRDLDRWVRPDEICREPKMIAGDHIDCFSIKQTVVSDCSFVASLAVCALYETRFKKKLITSIIYPKNKNKDPIVNPFGKYMVKLHINGVRRKVIIDELLPYSRFGRLLCSYSSNPNEFWVSLLEKAYMKVMGGYDFPGSNSNIDLHALTGWIPERAAIRRDTADFDSDAIYEKIRTRMLRGDVLVTVATGVLAEEEEERTGLVASHAYAVIDAQTANGEKLLKLKNPWSHMRWRGNYSELDTAHWTRDLRAKLNYDPDSAAQHDNGVFWIDYESVLHFFDVFYLNWNPALFEFTYCIHQQWNAGGGPIRDVYNISENPQFSLTVKESGAIWILLTRHITHIEDFSDNKEFIAVMVYKNEGQRVYYPNDPPPFIDGARINSPHYLCKLIIGSESCRKYTLVVSQYERMRAIYYTLRVYGTCPFSLTKLQSSYVVTKTITSSWSGVTAGGCANYRDTYHNNPKIRLIVPSNARGQCDILLDLKGPKVYQLGMDVRVESLEDPAVTAPFVTTSSGAYRSGFVVLELANLPCGVYVITPSTFYPNNDGPFILSVKSTGDIKLVPV